MITLLSSWDMHIFAICKKRQNSEKIWYYDNPQKLGEVYFLKSKNVTKCPQKNSFRKKKKKKNWLWLWLRRWQEPNKSNRMLCLHKTAIKKGETLQYESRHHRIHCSFYFFILSLLFILHLFQTKHICTSLSTSPHAPSLSLLERWWTMAYKHASICGLHT